MAKKRTSINKATAPGGIENLLSGKSAHTQALLEHFVQQYKKIGTIEVHPAKTMIGIATPRKRIAYVTQLGKNFVHVVFMFERPYHENLCFQKIAQVPGDAKQFNHHFRMFEKEDINQEVRKYMRLAYEEGS